MAELLSHDALPRLTSDTQEFIRAAYGLLLLAQLLLALPHARRFFTSERWGGYARSSPAVDAIQNPRVLPVVLAVWITCSASLISGVWAVWAAALNVVLCHYFFVWMRWRGLLRGMGAPGFMTYWLGVAVFLLELTTHYAPASHNVALFVLQVDFGVLFLSAGVYKLLAGYRRNYGVDLGLANPEWGYWWRFWTRLSPRHHVIKALNQLGWASEILAAILMLLPPTRFLGAALLIITFTLVRTQIRLGVLSEAVILVGVLYFYPGSPGARAVDDAFGWIHSSTAPGGEVAWLSTPLNVFLVAYVALLPFAYAGLYFNLLRRRALPQGAQRVLDFYTNAFGIILWRVFSSDVVNFFVLIDRLRADGGRERISRYGWRNGLRYAHVAESITVTSLFTSLKYFPSNNALFRERLLRYARTLPCERGEKTVFQYVSVEQGEHRFEHVPAAEFVVDVDAGTIEERTLRSDIRLRGGHELSPVHEAERPGTYAPATR
jgi:hypothetical protein